MENIRSLKPAAPQGGITFRKPTVADGAAVLSLIQECHPLDENSHYFYLVQCEQFRDTCVVAERDGEVIGWVSAHIPPAEEDTVFVWQVAVSPKARGARLGLRMLDALMRREECRGAERLRTTITRDNEASWGLFRKFAKMSGAEVSDRPHYLEDDHFEGAHDTEHLVTLTFAEPYQAAA